MIERVRIIKRKAKRAEKTTRAFSDLGIRNLKFQKKEQKLLG